MKILETLTPSAARSCGRAAKSLRSGGGLRRRELYWATEGKNRMCHRMKKRYRSRSTGIDCLEAAPTKGFMAVAI